MYMHVIYSHSKELCLFNQHFEFSQETCVSRLHRYDNRIEIWKPNSTKLMSTVVQYNTITNLASSFIKNRLPYNNDREKRRAEVHYKITFVKYKPNNIRGDLAIQSGTTRILLFLPRLRLPNQLN